MSVSVHLKYVPGRSREGAWIEISLFLVCSLVTDVAPVRERGLKLLLRLKVLLIQLVAPVRERGLKYLQRSAPGFEQYRRSREGAWIEISILRSSLRTLSSRSREGAWIEIFTNAAQVYATAGRSREGAWIEIVIF